MSKYQQALSLLVSLEHTLKQLDLWGETAPTNEQLSSTQPFAIDTLVFEQWLQFIFIPKMTILINNNVPLPSAMALLPMAQECYKGAKFNSLLTTIEQLDNISNTSEL